MGGKRGGSTEHIEGVKNKARQGGKPAPSTANPGVSGKQPQMAWTQRRNRTKGPEPRQASRKEGGREGV